MYLQFYGLREEPFGSTPDPRFLFASTAHREALASLQYSIETGRGFFALIAPPGMGKTTLLYQTLEQYHATAGTAFLFNTQCTSHEFLRFLLSEVGIEAGTDDVVGMHCRFNDFLVDNSRRGRRFILIVDEAQNLSSEVLETIRLLSNLETPRAKLMQIVLAGQPELYATLKRPDLAQLLQRVSMISRIETLTAEETREYVHHRLAVAGDRSGEIFSDEAIAMIADYSHGVPRLINSICFNALSLGYASEKTQIDVDLAMEAIADLPYGHGAANQVAPAPLYSSRAVRHALGSGDSAGFQARSRVVGMPSKPLVPLPGEVKAPPPTRPKPPMPVQAPVPMVAKSPTVAPVSFSSAATAPSLVQLASGIAQPVGNAEAPLPRPSVQRGLSAVPVTSSVPSTAGERAEATPGAPDSPPFSAPVSAPVNAAFWNLRASLSKAAPALLVLICCAAATSYLAVRHRAGKPATWTAQSVNSALPSSAGAAKSSLNAPAPAPPAPTLATTVRPADSPANAEMSASAPAPSGTAANFLSTPAPAAPAKTRKPQPRTASFEGVTTDTAVSVKPVPATSSADVSDAISDTAVTVFPQAIQRVEPEYPFLASKLNASGEVVLTATVNERGEPENLKFVEGNELFRQAAIDAASRWKYRPGTYNGRPVGMPVKIHLRFSSRFSASELESSQDLIRKEGTE